MPVVQDLKRIVEKLTGIGRPARLVPPVPVRPRAPQLMRLRDDGETPNNRLPLVCYRGALRLDDSDDPAALLEDTFAANGWRGAWRDGVYDLLHFHTATHEVLGIARGSVTVEFGGRRGRSLSLKAGDVVVLPAGTGHRRLAASDDLLVVGAYPAGGRYDEARPQVDDHAAALAAIARVKLPRKDPVYGASGPLLEAWRSAQARPAPGPAARRTRKTRRKRVVTRIAKAR